MKKLLVVVSLMLFAVKGVWAQNSDLPAKPNPQRLVNDYAKVLSAQEVQQLETKLDAYDDSTSTQIAIVIMPSIDDDISHFGPRLGDYWGIGGKHTDNGVLITIDMNSHTANISTGRGIEGAIPDMTAGQIIDSFIIPNFKQQHYFVGLDQTTTAIMQALAGEFKGGRQQPKDYSGYFVLGFIIFVIILSIIFRNRGGRGGGYYGSGGFWPIFLGGGFGGGGGGGGFGGFGGGSFGGGGASGSW